MSSQKFSTLALYFGLLQVFLIFSALIIEDGVKLIIKMFDLNEIQELAFLFTIWILMGAAILSGFKSMLRLLTLARIMDDYFTEEDGKRFDVLLKKLGKKTLSEAEKNELQSYIEKSPISNDLIEKYTSKKKTVWERMEIAIGYVFSFVLLVVVLKTWLDTKKSGQTFPPKKDQPDNSDNEPSSDK